MARDLDTQEEITRAMSDSQAMPSFVFEATAQNFQQDVLERSRSVPVVVDFWAPWCNPCLMLSPVLEKLARDYDGKFLLAKVNTESEPELSAQFGIRSIPAVYGLRDSKVLDAFLGVQPESMIRAWLDRLLPTPAQTLAAQALALEATDQEAAESKYMGALVILICRTSRWGWRGSRSSGVGLMTPRRGFSAWSGGAFSSPTPRSSRPS
jgi:thioredoxin